MCTYMESTHSIVVYVHDVISCTYTKAALTRASTPIRALTGTLPEQERRPMQHATNPLSIGHQAVPRRVRHSTLANQYINPTQTTSESTTGNRLKTITGSAA